MLEWHDFVEQLLSEESSFDGISLSFDGTAHSVGVPPIIKASVLMLDKMITHQGKFNILVFPERIQSIFIFTLIKLLHNIAEGKIERAYDPEAFKPGEKLKLGNAVVEFVGIEDEKNERRMKIKVADLTISAPIEYFPLFQLTNTQRRLSPYEKYVVEKKKIEGLVSHLTADEKFLKMLADYRTHMDSSIVSMTSVINAKELLSTCKLCGRDIKSILLVGQADYEGNVKNVGAGQLGGVPAVVLASDLYAIAALADQGHPIQSIIIDGSNANILLSQMDALDNLMRLGVPITCVTDIVNSFDLQPFLDRQFNVWRWDETSITDHLYNVNPLSSDRKIKHCAKREVKYLVSDGNEISIAIRKLYFHRGETQTLSVQMLKLFDKLFSLAFVALHETVPFNDDQLIRPKLILDECSSILAGEKNYLASKTYDDYSTIISCLKKVFIKGYPLPKHDALATRLRSEKYKSICIIVPERSDKKHVQEYWQMWCRRQRLITQVYVLYPAEYYPALTTQFSATVVVGWLKRAIMRKILYGFNTQTYAKLLDCQQFERKVPIYLPDGGYIEQLGFETVRKSLNPPWQSSIRPLSQEAYDYILKAAGIQLSSEPVHQDSIDVLKDKLKLAVRDFYVEGNSSAIHRIESIASAIGRATSTSGKENEHTRSSRYSPTVSQVEKLSRLLDYCKTMRMSYSYKPILILALLHYGDRDGCISIENAAVYFREYYSNRKAQGLAIEKKQCIYLRDDVTDAQIIANLLSNPVKALIESGFFFYNEDSHVFSVSPDIWSTIDRSNKAAITRICRQKLKDYYKD